MKLAMVSRPLADAALRLAKQMGVTRIGVSIARTRYVPMCIERIFGLGSGAVNERLTSKRGPRCPYVF